MLIERPPLWTPCRPGIIRPRDRHFLPGFAPGGFLGGGGGGGSAPDPLIATLFGSGEYGVMLDPSDLSTLWTDSIGGTNATVGDPVAYMEDKSGNSLHLSQVTLASRPILRQTAGGLYYLEFDGVNDTLGRVGANKPTGTATKSSPWSRAKPAAPSATPQRARSSASL